ncbi:MAG: hypothetical protein R3B93_06200 [Bacteroidia bacterium]
MIILGFLVGMFSCPSGGFAQNQEGMLIYQIDGNHYRKDNYDKNGKPDSYQIIQVGNVIKAEQRVEAKLTVLNYKNNGDLKDASQTTITCNPEARQVLVGIFPFIAEKSRKNIIVKMQDGNIFYPSGWQQKLELEDFSLNLEIKGGTAGFLGANSHIAITNRKVNQLSAQIYQISCKITLKAFIGGINVSTVHYELQEEIHNQTGIIKQTFTEKSGAYFILRLIKN